MSIARFIVDSINEQGLVIGRNCEFDIPEGFVFTSIEKTRFDGSVATMVEVNLGQVATVNLRLSEIHWYRRTIDHVPRGHTAGLRLSGVGLDELSLLLRELAPRESLTIAGSRNPEADV